MNPTPLLSIASIPLLLGLSALDTGPSRSFDALPAIDSAVVLGCSARPGVAEGAMPDGLTVVNGEVREMTREEFLELENVVIAEIVCWRAAERMFGLEVRSGVSSIVTGVNPLDGVREVLDRLPELQADYHSEHGTYSKSLNDLVVTDLPEGVRLEITDANARGWKAEGRHRIVNYVCHIFAGSTDRPRYDMDRLEAKCFSEHDHY